LLQCKSYTIQRKQNNCCIYLRTLAALPSRRFDQTLPGRAAEDDRFLFSNVLVRVDERYLQMKVTERYAKAAKEVNDEPLCKAAKENLLKESRRQKRCRWRAAAASKPSHAA